MSAFQKQVKERWNPPKADNSKRVIAYIVLNKDGQVISRGIIKSSGNNDLDNSALKAIDDGVPYPKFQNGYDRDVVTIKFTFDYTVFNMNSINDNSNYSKKDLCEGWACKLKP